MNIEELNKLIQEELKAYLNENEEEVEGDETPEGNDDDIEVTTDEPAEEDDALDTLRQIYNMLKPIMDEEEPEMDMGDDLDAGDEEEPAEEEEDEEIEENLDRPNYKASDVQKATFDAEKIKGGLNESFNAADRFQKLANIKK
jgi:hypothetical protein